MSLQLITNYYNRVDKLIQFGGSKKETSVRNEFYNLLSHYGEKKNLVLVAELPVRGTKGRDVTPDGTLKNVLRLDYGYWESKDEALDLDEEIDKKVKKGYPLNNILFEDSLHAILFQGSQEVMRIDMRKPEELDRILTAFISFEKPEIRKFNDALEHFQKDIPVILKTLRERIDVAGMDNVKFISTSQTFLELCQAEINPDITPADVREMMIQHILTSDIFNKIFDDPEFHRHNNIANELENLNATLFNHGDRKNLLGSIEHYYDAINAAAAGIVDHHEKQKFLKALYENFYKAYNPKAADRLGVVYTPNEIVDFMIESTNHLLEKHFKRLLWDKDVEILDPATGTGTYICNMIDKCPPQYLVHKYKNEFHANDVAILPYYISNLNIEYTFKQKMKYYEEFNNLCFVDTLDNTDALAYGGKQHGLFGFSSENSRRIVEQNKRKISVIIGNPPYNANQKNENENNKNREYPYIDKRIKDTFIKNSTAQKTKVYDMYARFYRWAMDRVDRNGIIAFITNRSFIDSRTFDGFRSGIEEDFAYCYIIDTKSDVRTNPKIAGTTHNVFGIQTGVAVMFLVKSEKKKENCKIEFVSLNDEWRKEEKWEWFRNNKLENIEFEKITPDKNHNWINIANTDFESLVPLIDRTGAKSIFNLNNPGVSTNRDDWVYDFDKETLLKKISYTVNTFNNLLAKQNKNFPDILKWSHVLKRKFERSERLKFLPSSVTMSAYRPFVKQYYYHDIMLSDLLTTLHFEMFGPSLSSKNMVINYTGPNSGKPFMSLATKYVPDLHFVSAGAATQCLPLYTFNENGEQVENITDWGLAQFITFYKDQKIKKIDIFYYTYAVLHNSGYRKKYELNLKREFPRIPLYPEFWKWVSFGNELIELHVNYEKVTAYPLEVHQHKIKSEAKRQKEMFTTANEPPPLFGHIPKNKVKLKADKTAGLIEIDELTFLTGIPKEAWNYKLGNRSALEWVLDQYKEKKVTDHTIAEKFDTYRFANYKSEVIDLLKRICTVSIATMRIISEMEKE